MTHDNLYKHIGLRKIAQFIDPTILVDTDFIFPNESELNWFRVSDVADTPKKEIGYLTNAKKPFVVTKYRYDKPIGNFVDKTSNIKSIITKQKKISPYMKFLPHDVKKIKAPKTSLLIYNYGLINAVHKYRPSPLTVYHKWYNAFSSLVHSLSDTSNIGNTRHSYVTLELPSNIPTKKEFEKFEDKINADMVNYFPTAKHMNLLEIWKFLNPKLIKETLLYRIKQSQTYNITFILVYNNKITLLNLGTLIASVKEYGLNGTIQETAASTVRKLFLILVKKIVTEGSAKTMAEVKSNKTTGILVDNLAENEEHVDKIDVNGELDAVEETGETEINYDDITDDMMSSDAANTLIDNIDEEFKDLTDLMHDEEDPKSKIKKQLSSLKDNSVLTKRDVEIIEDSFKDQDKAPNPYGNDPDNKTLKDMLTLKPEDINIPDDLEDIPDINIIENKESLKDPIKAMDKHYLKKVYKKDLLSTIYSLQNNNIVIKSHEVETEETILGGIETHTIEIKPLTGKPSKIVFKVPTINEDGTFKISGNSYKMVKQYTD